MCPPRPLHRQGWGMGARRFPVTNEPPWWTWAASHSSCDVVRRRALVSWPVKWVNSPDASLDGVGEGEVGEAKPRSGHSSGPAWELGYKVDPARPRLHPLLCSWGRGRSSRPVSPGA